MDETNRKKGKSTTHNADEVSDGHVTASVLESLGYHPANIGYNSDDGDSDDDVESLHSLSSENCDILKEAVRRYGRVQRFNMSFKKNDKKRLHVMIIDARDMMEIIHTKMMQRISKKAEATQKCWPSHAGTLRYEVAFGSSDQHVVDREAGVCSCRKWNLTGQRTMLTHAIIRQLRSTFTPTTSFPLEEQINRTSSKNKNHFQSFLQFKGGQLVDLRKKRRNAADEQDNGPSRGHRTLEIKCSKCGKSGHNIRSCSGQVRGNSRLNTPLSSATSASPAPSP
ncbi:hypothetical protein V6N13_104404 [Hibiscus sabdariffa]